MGAGASFENGLGAEDDQYYCHVCHRVFTMTFRSPTEMTCPYCDSAAIEEVPHVQHHTALPIRRNPQSERSPGSRGVLLTADQSRRMSNATLMLRLLESQLREELESLQFAFENAHTRLGEEYRTSAQPSKPKLSKIMIGKLRSCTLDVDLVCSQPSCPICSEDFVVSNEETKLPCGHIFHRYCVMPWLEQKQNCPICRTSLTDDIPTLAELEKLPLKELHNWVELMESEETSSAGAQPKATVATALAGESTQVGAKEDASESTLAQMNKEINSSGSTSTAETLLNRTKLAVAAKLQRMLQSYQTHRNDEMREAELRRERQAAAAAAERAQRLQHIDDHLSDLMTHTAVVNMTSSALGLGNRGAATINSAGGGGGRSARGEASVTSAQQLRPQPRDVASAALHNFLRHGAAATSSPALTNSNAAANAHHHHHHHAHHQSDRNADTHALFGSTRLPNGTEVQHRIRIVDDDSASGSGNDSDPDESNNVELQELYRRAHAEHMATFAGSNTVHALSSPNLGSPMQHYGYYRLHSDGHMTSVQSANDAFHRAMHPELSDVAPPGWDAALAEGSSRSRRSGFNGIGVGPSSPERRAAPEWSDADAVVRTTEYHNLARASAAPHAPLMSPGATRDGGGGSGSGSGGGGSGGSSGDDEGSGGSVNDRSETAAAVAGAAVSNTSTRMERINSRVSAIDRYMSLTAPELFGGSNTSSRTTLGASGGASETGPAGVVGTTFQVRATGGGSYATVAGNGQTGSTEEGRP